MAYYHADVMPPPDSAEPVPIDRKDALKAGNFSNLLTRPWPGLQRETETSSLHPVPASGAGMDQEKSLPTQSGTNLGDMEPRLSAY